MGTIWHSHPSGTYGENFIDVLDMEQMRGARDEAERRKRERSQGRRRWVDNSRWWARR